MMSRGNSLGLVTVFVCGLWGAPASLPAQSGTSDDTYTEIDDLFSVPDDGSAADESPTGEVSVNDEGEDEAADEAARDVLDIAALTTGPTKVTGSVSASAGANLGFNEWPESAAAEERTWRDLLEASAGYTMSTSVAIDSRPEPYLRYRAKLSSSLNPTSLGMSTPAFTELFIDYTVQDSVFFRAGKFGMGWGRARLFSSPGNLVSRVGSGAAVRASGALGLGSLTGVLYTTPSWISAYEQGDPRSFAAAVQLEQTAGRFTLELAGHYQRDEDLIGAATFTVGLGNLTLAGEERYQFDTDADGVFGPKGIVAESVANFFWENDNRRWTFWGEYSHNTARRDLEVGDDGVRRDGEHLVGLAMKAPSFGAGGWRPQLTWRHAVGDISGQVIAGTSGTIAPNLKLSFGMPVFYGKPGSYFRNIVETRVISDDETVSTDNTLTDEEEDLLNIYGQDVISVTFGLSISFSF